MKSALANFQNLPLKAAARQLLAKLGYQSDKFLAGAGSSPQAFLDLFGSGHAFDQAKALFAEWKTADLLFQLTDQELSRETSLFTDTSVKASLLKSYVFIAIELTGSDYARGKFSAIARQINRLFPMPVMVFFKCGADIPVCDSGIKADKNVRPTLTIAVINRRANKLDETKDVLGKVTLISGIDLAQPHRGHLDILASLALPKLVHPQKKPITDFDTLHAAWEQIFNVELLNERFYRELANWYFWALPQVEFPADLEPDDEKRRATSLIRLLTRLIFCWFLKEKNLIPEKLFHPTDLANILKGFDPESATSSTYYYAILQNLFFATLNQRMGQDAKDQPYRAFAQDEGFAKNRATYDINNLYRYESLFRDEPAAALAHFADIPFLNGGLFECFDRTEDGTNKKLYLDGFSRRKEKRPTVPNRLFFDSGETANLSTAYGDTKRKAERVTGLIHILNRYKFTIVENTPIEQEIALDPELLGKVFENLLASYNEETKTTARKQTGSFYTPRPIVDYMVDESLKAHLEQKVAQTILSGHPSSDSSPEITKTHRNLPHWTKDNATYWITFRLADSLPQEKLNLWKAERDAWVRLHPEPWDEERWNEYNERFSERLENWLDAGAGECPLRRPEVRAIFENCLRHFDGQRYDLIDWVIMPNHVHLLIRPRNGQSLSKILQGIKGVSAKDCNALLGRTGQTFWQEESYDHIVRSQAQLDHFARYIAENPVKAKLREGEYTVARTILSGIQLNNSPDNPGRDSSQQAQTGLSGLRSKLDLLFAYTEKAPAFTPAEVATLIAAIDALKILDPACGSGAFPMGVLHKLVYILGKLDEKNERWEQIRIDEAQKITDAEERRRKIGEIASNFADNNDDYGRKLYLIENCLYGVDIQPIAIQITKLRFFISLV
jgi:REP element-mobilizing transposase RayT